MKTRFLMLICFAACIILISCSFIAAQDYIEPLEIKGSHIQEFKDIKVEITGIKRMQEYSGFLHYSRKLHNYKLVADEGFEIAVVQVHSTTTAAKSRGFSVNYLYLIATDGKEYQSNTQTFTIGAKSRNPLSVNEYDYEFPVMIPKDVEISTVQLHQPIRRNTQPYTVYQKISFDVSKLY